MRQAAAVGSGGPLVCDRLVRPGSDRHAWRGRALGLIAGQPGISSRPAWSAIAGNALSGAVILPLAVTDVVPLTGPGIAFMVAGALWAMTFAGLALVGLRRSRRLP